MVTPYYNKPTQEGMYLHFKAIADAVDLPMIIYNIPPRSVVDMSVETMARLAKHKNIVGVKDATANLTRPLHTRRACGDDFCQLSGEDHTALAFNAAGGVGCISVTANVAPRLWRRCRMPGRKGGSSEAMAIQNRLVPLHDALFSETSPAPVKFARVAAGQDVRALPPAAGADHGEHADQGARGDDRCGAVELEAAAGRAHTARHRR